PPPATGRTRPGTRREEDSGSWAPRGTVKTRGRQEATTQPLTLPRPSPPGLYNPARMPTRRGLAWAAGIYLALSIVWTGPSSLRPWERVPDLGDPLHLAYVMAWDAHQVVRRPWALYDSNSFYPYEHSLAFGDHLLPEALMVAPIQWTTGNAVLASNVCVVL